MEDTRNTEENIYFLVIQLIQKICRIGLKEEFNPSLFMVQGVCQKAMDLESEHLGWEVMMETVDKFRKKLN